MMATKVRCYEFGDFAIDLAQMRLTRRGTPRPIEPKSFKVLCFLLQHRGRVVSKEEILAAVSQDAFVTDNALTRTIAQIRKALDDDAKAPRFVETVPTVGYRFIGEVREGGETIENSEPSQIHHTPMTSGSWFVRHQRTAVALIAAALGIAAAAYAFRLPRTIEPRAREIHGRQFTSSPELDITPAFSPDGGMLAYASDRSGTFQIYVRSIATGGRELQLTSDDRQNLEPSFSPDGQSIAYASIRAGAIFVVPVLGGTPRKLTDFGSKPTWSPDGRTIAFESNCVTSLSVTDALGAGVSAIYTVAAEGGAPVPIAIGSLRGSQRFPTWSSDGRQIRFVNAIDPTGTEFWSYSLDSRKLHKLATAPFRGLGWATISRDAKWLYAVAGELNGDFGIVRYTLDPRTGEAIGNPEKIFHTSLGAPRDFAISADGKRAAYTLASPKSDIVSSQVSPDYRKASAPKSVTPDISFRYAHTGFSPNGEFLTYTTWRRADRPVIYVARADGSDARALPADRENQTFSSFTADGKSIRYFVRTKSGVTGMTASLEDGSAKPVGELKDSMFMTFSPDGREAAFNRFVNGTRTAWRHDFTTGKETQIAPGEPSVGFPRYSPDGKWFSIELQRGNSTYAAVVPVGGGKVEMLVDKPGLAFSHGFSSDNDKVFLAGFYDGVWNIYQVSRTTKEIVKLSDYRSPRTYVRYPEVSVKRQLIYEFNEVKGNVFLADLP